MSKIQHSPGCSGNRACTCLYPLGVRGSPARIADVATMYELGTEAQADFAADLIVCAGASIWVWAADGSVILDPPGFPAQRGPWVIQPDGTERALTPEERAALEDRDAPLWKHHWESGPRWWAVMAPGHS